MTRLHHLALGARDVETVARFYREVFGLGEDRRYHHDDGRLRSVWLDLGGARLMIEHTETSGERVEGVGAGPFLIALSGSADDRERFERAVEAWGAPVEDRTRFTSYARDPEGNRVALSTLDYDVLP